MTPILAEVVAAPVDGERARGCASVDAARRDTSRRRTDVELPTFDLSDQRLTGETYHRQLRSLREQGWLARSPLALVVLDRAAGDFFLRSRGATFPGRELAGLFGITSGPLYDHIDANILNLSDEHHRRLRSLVSRAFTPIAADRWRPTMRELLGQLWDGRGEPDRWP